MRRIHANQNYLMPHLFVSRVRLVHVVVLIRQENTGCTFSSLIYISESRSSAVFSFLQVRSSSGAVIKGTNNQQTRVISAACWAEIKNGMRTVWSDLEERAGGGQGEGITARLLINSMSKKRAPRRRRCPFHYSNEINLRMHIPCFGKHFVFIVWIKFLLRISLRRLNLLFRNLVVIVSQSVRSIVLMPIKTWFCDKHSEDFAVIKGFSVFCCDQSDGG